MLTPLRFETKIETKMIKTATPAIVIRSAVFGSALKVSEIITGAIST